MAWHVRDFNGHCLLYTHGRFDNTDGHLIPVWGSSFYCGLSLFINAVAFIVSLSQLITTSVFLYQGVDSSFLNAFVDAVVSCAIAATLFVSSVFVSDGFRSWCSTMKRFPGCEEGSVMEWDPADGIVSLGFYVMMGTAQFAHWAGWVGWVLQSVLCIRKLCIYHERENIIISMARERKLLNASQKAYTEIMQNAPYDSETPAKYSDRALILK